MHSETFVAAVGVLCRDCSGFSGRADAVKTTERQAGACARPRIIGELHPLKSISGEALVTGVLVELGRKQRVSPQIGEVVEVELDA